MTTEKLSYDEMAEIVDVLSQEYLAEVSRIPMGSGTPVLYNGAPTSSLLLEAWEAHRRALVVAFEEGGWDEDDFEAEVSRRVSWD